MRIQDSYTYPVTDRGAAADIDAYIEDVAAMTDYLEQKHADVEAGTFTLERFPEMGTSVLTWHRGEGNAGIVDGEHPAQAADPDFVPEQFRDEPVAEPVAEDEPVAEEIEPAEQPEVNEQPEPAEQPAAEDTPSA